mgnify:CR=1 FL=1
MLCAAPLIGKDEFFAVMLPDDLIDGHPTGVLKQMLTVASEHNQSVLAIEQVPREDVSKYGIVDPASEDGMLMKLKGIVEADIVVNAAGAWAPRIAALFGQVLHVRPERHEAVTILLDQPLDVLDEHRLPGAVAPAAMPAATDEVRIDRALAALRVAHQQPRTALPAEHGSLQVVLMDLRRIRGRAVRAEHGLHLIPHLVGDDRLVRSGVGDALVADAALVVRVRQHPMHRRLADGSGRSPRRRRSREAARNEFLVELARRPGRVRWSV